MGLFDKFKKKKESGAQAAPIPATSNVEATPEQDNNVVSENVVDVGNQAVVANVGLESNPFVEQNQVTEQPQEVEQVQPSFDNVFNADPTTLIDPSLSENNLPQAEISSDMQVQNVNEGEAPLGDVQQTAAVVDNPMPATVEQNGIEVNPQEMFSNEIPKEDEITQMVAAAADGNGAIPQTNLPTEENFEINMSGSTNPDEFIEASELVETPENTNAVIEQTEDSSEVPSELVNETINENNNVVEVENTPDIALQAEVEPANNEVPIQSSEPVTEGVQNDELVEITNPVDNSQNEIQSQAIEPEMSSAEINYEQINGEENTLQDIGTFEQNIEGPVTQDEVVTENLEGSNNLQTNDADNTIQDYSNVPMVESEPVATEEPVIDNGVQNIVEEETPGINSTDQAQTQIEATDINESNGEEIVDIQATDNFIPPEIAESQNDVIELQTPEEVVEPQNTGNDIVEIVAGEPQETVISPTMIESNEPEETEAATSENEEVTDDTINDTDYKEEAQDIDVAASPIVIPEVDEITPVTENENVQVVSEDNVDDNSVITENETTEENVEETPTTDVTEDVPTDEEASTDEITTDETTEEEVSTDGVTDINTLEEGPENEVAEEPVEETSTAATDEANVEDVSSTEPTEQDSEEADKEPITTEEEAQEETTENEITEEANGEEVTEDEEPPKADTVDETNEKETDSEETNEDKVSEELDNEEVIMPIVPMESDEQQEDDVVQNKEEDLDNEEAVDHVLEAIAKIDVSKKEVKDSKKKQEQADSVIASIINGEDETEDDEEEEEDITENSDDKPLIEEDEEHVLPLIEEKEDDIVIHTDNKVKPLIEEEENEIKILSLDDNDNKHKNKKDFTIPPFAVSVDGSSVSTSNVYLKQEELLKKAATYIEDPTPTKFCDNCGTILTEDCSICPSCGEPID